MVVQGAYRGNVFPTMKLNLGLALGRQQLRHLDRLLQAPRRFAQSQGRNADQRRLRLLPQLIESE
jgi:hypothetical protein